MGLVCGFMLNGQRMSPAVSVKECHLPSSHNHQTYLEGNSIGQKKRILTLNSYIVAQMVKSLPASFSPLVWKIPWRRKWQPRQCSCLGNPMDGGTWQATVYGVAKSQT